ncbi:hypothetical protein yaldo0001_19780 [Yersinia aldovae ATCC 35236]|nr:hypothetical protein yaldo0001_19780 [Yersinia aldovae ATCC 35236]
MINRLKKKAELYIMFNDLAVKMVVFYTLFFIGSRIPTRFMGV